MTETAILTGPERRRRWREADRLRIVEETCAPGGSISEVARRYDISRSRIYAWRREFRVAQNPTFFPVVVPDADSQSGPEAETALVLDFPDGRRLRIAASAPPALVAAALKAAR